MHILTGISLIGLTTIIVLSVVILLPDQIQDAQEYTKEASLDIQNIHPCQQNTLEILAFEKSLDPTKQNTTFEEEKLNKKYDELTNKMIDCNYIRTEWYNPEFHEKIKTLFPERFP